MSLRSALAVAAAALVFAAPGRSALAQSARTEIDPPSGPETAGPRAELPDTTWRAGSRERREDLVDPDFLLETRFGPYWPEIDEEFGAPGPYETVFDNDPQFYFGLEIDWLPFRIPYVGKIGAGLGWGITPATGFARIPGTTEASAVETSLTIMPMHASLVLRGSELMSRTEVPLVPYGKLGFGFATWSTSTSSGTSEVCEDDDDPDTCAEGEDTTLGVHVALGLALALDWVEPERTKNLQAMGIGHLYLFGEWMHAALDGLGSRPQLHVGTSTFVGGAAMDF
jgi:hypothetical protein